MHSRTYNDVEQCRAEWTAVNSRVYRGAQKSRQQIVQRCTAEWTVVHSRVYIVHRKLDNRVDSGAKQSRQW